MKNTNAALSVIFVSLMSTGCANYIQEAQVEESNAKTPIVCNSEEQCSEYMNRAKEWIARESRSKITIATDTLIQTGSSGLDPTYLDYTVNRNKNTINVYATCKNTPFCNPNSNVMINIVKRYMLGN